ncbi:MAG: hypothetical protein U0975_01755 [Erythrobacter sp.]|nr:hypothetical protein [Erythrobacter sp.]MDZ4271375.1 hypothetical protein [Erythrobacter sp.]
MKAAVPVLVSALMLTACVPASTAPASAPAPEPAARPAPVPVAPPPEIQSPAYDNWMDAPASTGDWRYTAQGGRSEATFWGPGERPMMRLRCPADRRGVILSLPESGSPRPLVTIRTETTTRTLAMQPAGGEMILALSTDDALLDAMALSKGRFAVEATDLPALIVPSWAEVTRVIEDCR